MRLWHSRTVPDAVAQAVADVHAVALRKRRSLPLWRAGVAHALERRAKRSHAERHRDHRLRAASVEGWSVYVALRQSRRRAKAKRLQELRGALDHKMLRRVLLAWADWHTVRLAHRAVLAVRTATFHWGLQTRVRAGGDYFLFF